MAVEQLPGRIDLGEFGREAERLLQLTQADRKHAEYASVACVDAHERMLLLREPIRGDAHNVPLPTFTGTRSALVIHSHPVDAPFSIQDLTSLLIAPGQEKAVPAELVVTPSQKILLLRTAATPALLPLTALGERYVMNQHPALRDEQALSRENSTLADRVRQRLNRPPKLRGSYHQGLAALSHKRMYWLTRAAEQYHLALYTCALDQNIVASAS